MFEFYGEEDRIQIVPNSTTSIKLKIPMIEVGASDYIGVKILKERTPFLFIDTVKTIQGRDFRTYANIDSMDISLRYDKIGFLRDIILSKSHLRVMDILEMISTIFKGDPKKVYRRCYCASTGEPVDCKEGKCLHEDKMDIMTPVGWWNDYDLDIPSDKDYLTSWPKEEVYTFAEDFFLELNNEIDVPIFMQFITNAKMRDILTKKYMESGFGNYNFNMNCRRTLPKVQTERFEDGFSSLNESELNTMLFYIFDELSRWYGEEESPMNSGAPNMKVFADQSSIENLTPLRIVDTKEAFDIIKPTIDSIFGSQPICRKVSALGQCTELDYEGTYSEDDMEDEERGIQKNQFMIVSDSSFLGYGAEYLSLPVDKMVPYNSFFEEYRMSATDALLSIMYSNGIFLGKTIFDNGTGTEWMLEKRLSDFLEEENMSIDEFMENISGYISGCIENMEKNIILTEEIDPEEIIEFYDENHTSPLDGISVYVPLIVGGSYTIEISKREEDSNGDVTIYPVKSVECGNNTLSVMFDRNEFASKITCSAAYYFMSDRMELDVNIVFKSDPVESDDYGIRISRGEYSILKERVVEKIYG